MFTEKEDLGMDNFFDLGLGNCIVLNDVTNIDIDDQVADGSWRLYFDNSCSKNGLGSAVVIESLVSKVHPQAFMF